MSKLKKEKLFLAFIMLYMVTLGVLCFDTQAYAATSGTIPCSSGSVSWTLDDNGTLTFGGSGTTNLRSSWDWCWRDSGLDTSKVTSVKVATGSNIILNRADKMFYRFDNCTSISMNGIDTSNVTNMSEMFADCSKLQSLDLGSFNTSNVTDMHNMFYFCLHLTSLDVSGFDTSKVTDMHNMFYCCKELAALDVSNFRTSNVTNMSYMFASCPKVKILDVADFDTSKVTDMSSMFSFCANVEKLDIKNFDTSNVTNMGSMFSSCKGLTSLDVTHFDTSKVTDMGYMFSGCEGLTSLDVTCFDTSEVTNMEYMFSECVGLTSLDVTHFDTSKVTIMGGMFSRLNLTSLDITNFDTTNVTNMARMFRDCNKLTALDVTHFNTSKVNDMSSMFSGCSSLTQLDVTHFDTSKVTSMSSMFSDCSALEKLDVSKFNTHKVQYMRGMFHNCSTLKELDVSNFDTGNLKYMNAMFSGCLHITSLDLSKWDTSKMTDMGASGLSLNDPDWGIFERCCSLVKLDISNFDTSNVTDMSRMFYDCRSLTQLDVSHFDTSKVTDMSDMFGVCYQLLQLDVSHFGTSQVANMSGMFSSCKSLSELDVSNFDTSNVTDMSCMFQHCMSLSALDVSEFDTSKVTNMYQMFYNCDSLLTLDLNSFDTSKVTDMNQMFMHSDSLKELDLSSFDTSLYEPRFASSGHVDILNDNLEKLVTPKTSCDINFNIESNEIIYDNKGNFYYSDTFVEECEPLTEFHIVPSTFAINYVYEGELVDCPTTYSVRDGQASLGSVNAEHYTFEGWYTDDTYQTKVTEIKKETVGDITLYAKMIPVNYSIVYENVEPAISLEALPIEYPYGVGVELPDIESECYSFAGWYEDEELTKKITEISKTVSGTVTVYAKWTPVHKIEVQNAKEATCQDKGYTGDEYCLDCDKKTLIGREIPPVDHDNSVVKNAVEATCITDGYTGDKHCKWCDVLVEQGESIAKKGHDLDRTQGTITLEPTTTTEGTMEYPCKNCDYKETEAIPKVGADFIAEEGIPEETVAVTDETILGMKDDGDVKGSSFVMIQARADKNTKNSTRLKWSKVKNADGYKIYGNKCGKKNRMKLLKTIENGKTTTFTQKKLKKGTYYKYIVRAYKLIDGKQVTIAVSKTIHSITKGGKYGVAKAVKIKTDKKMKSKKGSYTLTIKKNKKYTIKASEVKESKKIKQHRKVLYESSDKAIATVSKKGVVKGLKKGTCYIYAYAQNGVYKKIKVKVN